MVYGNIFLNEGIFGLIKDINKNKKENEDRQYLDMIYRTETPFKVLKEYENKSLDYNFIRKITEFLKEDNGSDIVGIGLIYTKFKESDIIKCIENDPNFNIDDDINPIINMVAKKLGASDIKKIRYINAFKNTFVFYYNKKFLYCIADCEENNPKIYDSKIYNYSQFKNDGKKALKIDKDFFQKAADFYKLDIDI